MDRNCLPAKRLVDPFEEISAMLVSLPATNPPGFSMSASIENTYPVTSVSNSVHLGWPKDTSWLLKENYEIIFLNSTVTDWFLSNFIDLWIYKTKQKLHPLFLEVELIRVKLYSLIFLLCWLSCCNISNKLCKQIKNLP